VGPGQLPFAKSIPQQRGTSLALLFLAVGDREALRERVLELRPHCVSDTPPSPHLQSSGPGAVASCDSWTPVFLVEVLCLDDRVRKNEFERD
jgi:hypothetical protein